VLLAATSFPAPAFTEFGISDKVNHFLAYFILAFMVNLAIIVQEKYPWLKKNSSIKILFIVSIYAVLDEVHQAFIPGRSCEFLDWVADFAGAALGIVVLNFILYRIGYPKSTESQTEA
jgi:VanZ family protein